MPRLAAERGYWVALAVPARVVFKYWPIVSTSITGGDGAVRASMIRSIPDIVVPRSPFIGRLVGEL